MPSQGLQQVQRLGLQQTLSPQMQQSLHILQIPALELNQLIRQELTSNPVLEETQDEEAPEEENAEEVDAAAEEAEFKEMSQLDEEWRDYFSQNSAPTRRTQEEERQRQTFFESVAKGETLQEHLLAQVQGADLSESQRKLCETLVGNIDDRGFLVASKEDMDSWSAGDSAALEDALHTIQSFDPIGVGSRDLRECLLFQLVRLGYREDSLAHRVVAHHLDDLAAKKFAEISESLNVTLDEIYRAASLVATLDPQPGSRFSSDESRYITADMTVQKVGEDWVVIMNDDWLPTVRISNTYKDILGQSSQGQEVKSYVRERIRAARFLIKSIQQRQQTILKIAYEIVHVQINFFNQGRSFLKPLTMTEVAQKIGVHETTVSRAIANKYMQTPHGIYELKYFFTPGIRLADGGVISQDEVKNSIAEFISNESPGHPLTDQEIMNHLQEKKIPIARRTVAKYREELKILPSHLRKSK